MQPSIFKVPLADLEQGPKSVDFDLSLGWLADAFAGTEATAVEPGLLSVEVSKNGREVMVRGRAQVQVTMPCSRTLEPVPIALTPEIFLMLSQASATRPGRSTARRKKGRGAPPTAETKPKKDRGWDDDPPLDSQTAASDTFSGEEVVLDPFVREFLLLDLPMFPVRSDLPPVDKAAIPPAPSDQGEVPIDPRLAPLQAIAERLRKKE